MPAPTLALMLAAAAPALGPLDAVELYRQRTQVSEAVNFGSEVKFAVAEHWVVTGTPLPDAAAFPELRPEQLANPDRGVERIEIRNGTLIITLGGNVDAALAGQVVAVSLCRDAGKDYLPVFACGQDICPPSARAVPGGEPAFTLTTLENDVLPASCRGHGRAYLNGMKAMERGEPLAQAEWATVLWDGQAVPEDRQRALDLARASAGAGNAFGMWALGSFLARGEPDLLPADLVQAYAWFLRSAAQGLDRGIAARDELRGILTPEQLAQAEALAAK